MDRKDAIEIMFPAKEKYNESTYYMGRCDALAEFRNYIVSLQKDQQEQPKLTQVPGIEQEIQKKGWMNYGLLISEIGLHRSNAIDRIEETKERATEIKRNIAPHDLAILGKYMKSVGEEIVLCCLQQYCMDFMFTQDEVKEIIQQEQPKVDLDAVVNEAFDKYSSVDGYGQLSVSFNRAELYSFIKKIARNEK